MRSFTSLSVIALLFATAYSAPTIRQRLGQVKETKLAQVEAQQDCGCGCEVDYPIIPDSELPGAGNLEGLADGVNTVHYASHVDYDVGAEFIPTTTTQTKSAAESCHHTSNKGKQGSTGVRCRHFEINGGICVNEWVDSCEFECGWEKTEGCSAKAQTSVSGLADVDGVDLSATQPEALSVSVSTCGCHCDESAAAGRSA
jgi:hypothetical protein